MWVRTALGVSRYIFIQDQIHKYLITIFYYKRFDPENEYAAYA
jgi:hypothetical protein